MRLIKTITAAVLITAFLASPATLLAGEAKGPKSKSEQAEKKAKPYPLDTCIVSGEKLGADASMKPYAFVHKGQEVKLCCQSCKKDFDKDPAKYLSKMKEEAKKAKKADKQKKS